jgi:hypothetical protein
MPSPDAFASRWKRRSRLVRMNTTIRALDNRLLTGIRCISRKRERRAVPEWFSERKLGEGISTARSQEVHQVVGLEDGVGSLLPV